MKKLTANLTTAQTVFAIITGLITGAFALVYAYWQFSDRLAERQKIERQAENQAQAEAIADMVSEMWAFDIALLRQELRHDTKMILDANLKRDSVLIIVLPRMNSQIRDVTETVKRIEAQKGDSETSEQDRVWKFLMEREQRDSIYRRDLEIMRQLRSINQMLQHKPKYGDRIE